MNCRFFSLALAPIWISTNLCVPAAQASDLPPAVLPEGVGVNIHFTRGHERDLDLIAAAGVKFVRMDFSWSGTERQQGEYSWTDYDELTSNLDRRGLRALFILDYSNSLYEDTITSRDPISGKEVRAVASPSRPESVAAFSRWAAAAAKHFRGRRVVWEIWNEPNIGFWKPKPDVKQYLALATATCRAVRAADPDATILAPASSGFPWKFLEDLIQSGILADLDGISVHPYRNYSMGPETVVSDYLKLRALIERHAPSGKKFLPIVSGEWGYATHTQGVSLETQAAFVVRQQLVNLQQHIPLSMWYDWKNDGTNSAYNEHNFGIVSDNLIPKPSYRAVQTMTRELAGYQIARRLLSDSDTWALLLTNRAGSQKLACWTTDKPRQHDFPIKIDSLKEVSAVDATGTLIALNRNAIGLLGCKLFSSPSFISFLKPNRQLLARTALEIQGPLPILLRGGHAAPETRMSVRVRNPFNEQIRVQLRGPNREEVDDEKEAALAFESRAHLPTWDDKTMMRTSQTKILTPGKEWLVDFSFHPPRTGQISAVHICAVFSELDERNAWRFLTCIAEPYQFTVVNPIALAIAPVETGVRLYFQNPSGEAFEGKVIINNRTFPVQWPAQSYTHYVDASLTRPQGMVKAFLSGKDNRQIIPGVERRLVPIHLETCQALLDGEPTVTATARLTPTNALPSPENPFTRQWELNYHFDQGWRFVRCTGSTQSVVSDKPIALGLWVRGDNSGNVLRTRLRDEAGQTFQPDGPELDWSDWRWIEFDLTQLKQAGHWGGANDGVPHGALHMDTLLVLDSRRSQSSGTVRFCGPAWIYPGP
jgi:hypothetical protein